MSLQEDEVSRGSILFHETVDLIYNYFQRTSGNHTRYTLSMSRDIKSRIKHKFHMYLPSFPSSLSVDYNIHEVSVQDERRCKADGCQN